VRTALVFHGRHSREVAVERCASNRDTKAETLTIAKAKQLLAAEKINPPPENFNKLRRRVGQYCVWQSFQPTSNSSRNEAVVPS
jgi:hypothetical protein